MDVIDTPPPGGSKKVGNYDVVRLQDETEEHFQKRVRTVARINSFSGGDPVGLARASRTAGRLIRLLVGGVIALALVFVPISTSNGEPASLLKIVLVRVVCSAIALVFFFFAVRMLLRQRKENAERAPLRTGGK